MTQLTLDQALQLAKQWQQSGRLADAENLYRQILAQEPNHVDALNQLSLIAVHTNNYPAAIDLMKRSLAIAPAQAWLQANLGEIYRRTGNLQEAIATLQHAIALTPNDAVLHYNLGVALDSLDAPDEAIAAYQQSVAINPNLAEVRVNLGNTLMKRGRLAEAEAAFREALRLNPQLVEACNNLGNVLREQGHFQPAIETFHRALAINSNHLDSQINLGNALKYLGQLDAAITAYRRALDINPNSDKAHNNLGNAYKDQGRIADALACFDRTIKLRPNDAPYHSNRILTMHYDPRFDAAAILHECREFDRRHALPLRQHIAPPTNDRSPNRRLKIGYVSPDFRAHSVAAFLKPLLAHHNRANFEIYAYSDVRRPDQQTADIRKLCDHWRDLVGLSDSNAAAQIRNDQIDILIDLALHSSNNRMLTFARKPAPIQLTWLGYPGTTGLATMDYRLSDPHLDPPGSDSRYTEKTIRLPHTFWCYQPTISTPDVSPLPVLTTGHITFGCLNTFAKVGPQVLDLWARLLAAIPNSRLLLHTMEGSHRNAALQHFTSKNISPDRITFIGFQPLIDYYRQHHAIDIALDPFPFGGGTTTCDALWMGVPVITLVGRTAVGRGGATLLTNAGLPDLIAHSPDEYLTITTQLATNLPALAHLRATLRTRLQQSPIMNAPQFASGIESAYRQIWRKWCNSPKEVP